LQHNNLVSQRKDLGLKIGPTLEIHATNDSNISNMAGEAYGAGTAHRASLPYGSGTTGAGFRAHYRRDNRRKAPQHAFRETYLVLAALDAESDVDQVDLASGMEELRRRLEVLLGARPEAPPDESLRHESELAVARATEERSNRREKLAVCGGQLLSAAFQFLGELLPAPSNSSASNAATKALAATLKQSLTDLVEHADRGRPRLSFALPDATALDNLTNVLARLLAQSQSA
jgi:hypothetical protein